MYQRFSGITGGKIYRSKKISSPCFHDFDIDFKVFASEIWVGLGHKKKMVNLPKYFHRR